MNCATKNSVERLTKDLKLRKGDEFTQDWEYENADCKKVDVFLLYYNTNQLDSDEKRTLMQLILESYNDYVSNWGFNYDYSKILQDIFNDEPVLFKDIIDYWACAEDELEDSFLITPFMREFKSKKR